MITPLNLHQLPSHDAAMLRPGFLRAAQLVLRLEEGSVLSAGPPCGSFVFLNSYTSGRSKDRPLGNARSRPYVKVANRILAHGWLN